MYFLFLFIFLLLSLWLLGFCLLYTAFQLQFWYIWKQTRNNSSFLAGLGCVCCLAAGFWLGLWIINGCYYFPFLAVVSVLVIFIQFCSCKRVWRKMSWTFWGHFKKWQMALILVLSLIAAHVWGFYLPYFE